MGRRKIEREIRSGIYCIERIETGEQYVGKSKRLPKRMWENHKNCLYIYNALQFYGKDAFSRYVIEYCEIDKLVEREQYYIKKWNTRAPNGYNLTDGGEGISNPSEETLFRMSESHKGLHPSEETRKKMGEWQMGENNNRYGWKPQSDEEREFLSQLHKGENNGFYGRNHTEESIERIRISKIGKKASQETRELMSKNRTGKRRKKNKNASSQFFGVYKKVTNGKYIYWGVIISEKGKKINIGQYKTEVDAAYAYDKYIIENNIDRPLNFPEEYGRSK